MLNREGWPNRDHPAVTSPDWGRALKHFNSFLSCWGHLAKTLGQSSKSLLFPLHYRAHHIAAPMTLCSSVSDRSDLLVWNSNYFNHNLHTIRNTTWRWRHPEMTYISHSLHVELISFSKLWHIQKIMIYLSVHCLGCGEMGPGEMGPWRNLFPSRVTLLTSSSCLPRDDGIVDRDTPS